MTSETINRKCFVMHCDHLRSRFNIKGILIYSDRAEQKLKVIGWPYPRISAVNDNEAAP